jgi:diadenosine tetraphosphate (Ap4A) HIT family hydrolase
MAKVHQQARLESMGTSILIHAVFYFMDLKQVVSGHFLQIFKDQQVQLELVAAMEKMEMMARMVLMERQ